MLHAAGFIRFNHQKELLMMHKSKIQQTIVRLREKRNPPISEEEALQKARDNFMKALTECLILARLSKGDSYGYEISQSIKACLLYTSPSPRDA